MTLILLIILLLVLLGGGYGWRSGYFAPGTNNPLGILLIVIVVILIIGLLLPFAGYHWYSTPVGVVR